MRPLDGLRVLDLSRLLPGPYATGVLSNLGATVDKLEDTAGGDYLRVMPPLWDGVNAPFRVLNRGKRSLSLDLKRPEAREAFGRLLPRYDVLVESFRPGVLAKLGLGHERLLELHPGLVVCAITGFGQAGPLAHRAGHDSGFLARAGVLGQTGPTGGAPQLFGGQVADIVGAHEAVSRILAALVARVRTGRGAIVDVSLCEAAASVALYGSASAFAGEDVRSGRSVLSGSIAPFSTYLTADGRAVALAALEPKFWVAFCAAVGLPSELDALMPGPHQEALFASLRRVFAARTSLEWAAFAETHDVCLEVVLEPAEVLAQPHFAATNRSPSNLVPMTHDEVDRLLAEPPPAQGQHTRAILREAGLEASVIDALLATGAAREA